MPNIEKTPPIYNHSEFYNVHFIFDDEICKPITYRGIHGYGYFVSNLGRIRNNETGTIRVLNPTGRGGHRQVTLRRKGRVYGLLIHRLVLEAFIGNCPKNMECRNLDGTSANNHLSISCWGTRK